MQDKLSLDFTNTKVKVDERSRGRMKITFKLNKEQAEAFKKFAEIKPDTNPDGSPFTDEEFYRHIFFVGVRALNDELRQMFEANKQLLEKQKAAALATQEEKPNQ